MGYTIECNNVSVWEPSQWNGNCFFANIKELEKLVEKESGIGSPYGEIADRDYSSLADTLDIDYSKLRHFIDELLAEFEVANSTPLLAITGVMIEILLALEANITGDDNLRKGTIRTAPLIERSKLIFDDCEFYLKETYGIETTDEQRKIIPTKNVQINFKSKKRD